jgi:transcriptional regulator with XRE-family HTH domain
MLIQKLRLQRGWSQQQLAELSGLSVRTVQRIERGQPASLETLKALGAAFEIDFSDLKEPDMNSTSSQHTLSQSTLNRNVSTDEALALAHVRKLKEFYLHIVQSASPSPFWQSSTSSHPAITIGSSGSRWPGVSVCCCMACACSTRCRS